MCYQGTATNFVHWFCYTQSPIFTEWVKRFEISFCLFTEQNHKENHNEGDFFFFPLTNTKTSPPALLFLGATTKYNKFTFTLDNQSIAVPALQASAPRITSCLSPGGCASPFSGRFHPGNHFVPAHWSWAVLTARAPGQLQCSGCCPGRSESHREVCDPCLRPTDLFGCNFCLWLACIRCLVGKIKMKRMICLLLSH